MTSLRETPPQQGRPSDAVLGRLSVLDRFLPVWIVSAMLLGVLLGRLFPDLDSWMSKVKIAGTSLPIAAGLLVMMYPVLAKVRYEELGRVTSNRRLLVPSLVLNWVIGPAVMFALAWLMLPDLPAYRTGLVIVGLARCIAMVLIWNDLAGGDREAASVLVALNSLFQIVAFAGLAYLYLRVGDPDVGGSGGGAGTGMSRSSSPRWRRSPSTGCCLPSWCSSLYRATPSPATRPTWPVSPCRYWRTSGLCGWGRSRSVTGCASATRPRPPWRSRRRATTSSWPSRWPSACSADQRPGSGRGGRPAHRGAGSGRSGVCGPLGPAPLLSRRGDLTVNCVDCASQARQEAAVGICADCGAGICGGHARLSPHWLTRTEVINRVVTVDPPARVLRCPVCQAARDAADVGQHRRAG